jgi:hypothetical protein
MRRAPPSTQMQEALREDLAAGLAGHVWSAKTLSAHPITHRMWTYLLINTAKRFAAIGASLRSQNHAHNVGAGPPAPFESNNEDQ